MRGLKYMLAIAFAAAVFFLPHRILSIGVAEAMRCASQIARLGWVALQPTPWASTYGNECLLLSRLLNSTSKEILFQALNKPSPSPFPPSHTSWHSNQERLSQIPAPTQQDQELINFLTKRWLAKANGFFTGEIDWVCPAYGYSVQVNPETTNCYARDPARQNSKSYVGRMNTWKKTLPQPESFPLVLTRPTDVRSFLPSVIELTEREEVESLLGRLTAHPEKVVIDLTKVLPTKCRKEWLDEWEIYRKSLLALENVVCIQKVEGDGIGGLRILPLSRPSEEHQFLLDWVSNLGLTANLVELDRCPISTIHLPKICAELFVQPVPKDNFLSFLNSFDWHSKRPETNLMVQGALSILKGLYDQNWDEIFRNPTHSAVFHLSVAKIQEELKTISEEEEGTPFYQTATHLEEIFAHISNLLEITAPFTANDFPSIYLNKLNSIPSPLKVFAACAIHASAMTSIGGIFKAVGEMKGAMPKVIYGENTYFECINVARGMAKAVSIEEATDADWREVDLILAQFHPVLKRSEPEIPAYKKENIAATIQKALRYREGKPLTAAIDCTIDFIDSPAIGELLSAFQKEIEGGKLNIVCYRSGLKFDLFGMDNYAGAPFFMIHNQDPKWAPFNPLTNDPSLLTDRLSASWFCLAYKHASSYLNQYRKTIFDNTRNLLNRAPSGMISKDVEFRIIPFEENANPSFVDIRISGPLHKLRGSSLIGGSLYLKCMEGGHPVFYRRTFGLYHPNFGMIFGDKSTTVRLTLGLDPSEIDLFADCFKIIDTLNGHY